MYAACPKSFVSLQIRCQLQTLDLNFHGLKYPTANGSEILAQVPAILFYAGHTEPGWSGAALYAAKDVTDPKTVTSVEDISFVGVHLGRMLDVETGEDVAYGTAFTQEAAASLSKLVHDTGG